jgi:protein tyrosine/serine phosphatase
MKKEGIYMHSIKSKAIISIMVLLSIGFAGAGEIPSGKRPDQWAQPVSMNGVPNLHKVSETLYRSAQPTAEGMVNLKAYGIKTIINLRSFNSDRKEIGDTGLEYEHLYMKAWHPEVKEAVRFLKIISDSKRAPFLVHCQHGADRTGIMCAIYRVAVQGWTKAEALKELKEGGYGFHEIWKNLPPWFEKLDIEAIKKQALE